MSRTMLLGALFTVGCTAPPGDANQEQAAPPSRMEGTFEYVGTQKGQSILLGGRYVFFVGPADGSGPMSAEAGTYHIVRDTATHTVVYATDPTRIGSVLKWTPESWSGDTIAYVVMNDAGHVTGRGRSVRR